MDQERSPEDIIRISSIPSTTETLIKRVHQPSELDEAVKNLNIPASLLNFHLATPLDLSLAGLGQVVHIPVQISEREGGRKSLIDLEAGEETLAGIYVTNRGIALRFIQRVTGSSLPAQTDDTYRVRLTNREGEVAFQGTLKLEVTDALAGAAKFHLIADDLKTVVGIWGECLA